MWDADLDSADAPVPGSWHREVMAFGSGESRTNLVGGFSRTNSRSPRPEVLFHKQESTAIGEVQRPNSLPQPPDARKWATEGPEIGPRSRRCVRSNGESALTDFNPHERNRDARHGMVLDPDRGPRSARRAIGIVVVALALFLVASSMPSVGSIVGPDALTLTILSKRTGPNEASALGTVENTPTAGGNLVELLVNGAVVRSTTSYGSGEYWFTKVPVSDGATIQTRVGSIYSASVPVPACVGQAGVLAGFIYAQWTHLMQDEQPSILCGINASTPCSWAIVA